MNELWKGIAIAGVWLAVAIITRDKRTSCLGFCLLLMVGCSVTTSVLTAK